MRDEEARLTSIYVTPHGSPVPSHSPNSEDTPAASFDLIIQGEEGDQLRANGSALKLSYWIVDLQTMAPVPAAGFSFNVTPNVNNQNTGDANWTARAPANEDFFTVQTFPITIPAGLSGHILQAFAVLSVIQGDIVSFVQSEPFVIV